MVNNNNIAQTVTSEKAVAKGMIKSQIFNLAIGVVALAIITISLDVFELRQIDWDNLFGEFLSWFGYFTAGISLNVILYTKGKYLGKESDAYTSARNEYSVTVAGLEDTHKLYEFCQIENERILEDLKKRLIKTTSITYEEYCEKYAIYNRRELRELGKFTKEELKILIAVKKAKIKGYRVNNLLGNEDVEDPTDLGSTESQLSQSHLKTRAIWSILSAVVLTFLGLKDIRDWGWAGLILVIFKTCYTIALSYLSYFSGYEDGTIKLPNNIARRTDILKEYAKWYTENKAEYVSNN